MSAVWRYRRVDETKMFVLGWVVHNETRVLSVSERHKSEKAR